MELGEDLLIELEDPDSRSIAYRAMSLAARNASTLEASVEYAELAARTATTELLRLESLNTLAASMAMAGQTGEALEVLEQASTSAEGLIAGQIQFQRGVVLTIVGDYGKALAAYQRALPVFEEHDRSDFVAMTLHNQGYIYTQTDRLEEAEEALTRAREIEEHEGRLMEVAGTDHNLGVLASYRGDIPEALRRLTMSDEMHMRQSGNEVPRHVTRCEILLSAGLAHEALHLAKRIAAGARNRGRADDEADALLVAARAAFASDDASQAGALARKAAERFKDQQRHIWVTQANLVGMEARYVSEGPSPKLHREARQAAEQLDQTGLLVAAARARLLAVRIAVELGDIAGARQDLAALGEQRSGPVELRVQRWQAKALTRLAGGNRKGADAAARAGLDVLDDYQAGLGASDLRHGIERQGAELGELGLRLAVDSTNPRRVFRWMERTRARALRFPPVVPAEDDPEQPVLVELRRVTAELRKPENRDDRDLVRRQRQLQEELRSRSRVRRGASVESDFNVDRLVAALGSRTLIEMGKVDGRLLAVTVTGGRFRLHELGEAATIEGELARLRFDMRRAARLGRDHDRVRRAVGQFGGLVLGKLPIGEEDVVLVPPGSLMAAPWTVLPALAGARVVVAPSAEMWWRGQRRSRSDGAVVLAAGPDLDHASEEIAGLDSVYEGATVLGPGNSAESFGRAVRGAAIAHAACHASFEVENPMFSSLRLGDGDFNVYDLERLHESPQLMVLSACDSGYTDTNAGDELTGLTSALLSMGSKSVVASIGLVPDSRATSDLMLRFHTGIRDGVDPPSALASAQAALLDNPAGYIAAASFLCIGSG